MQKINQLYEQISFLLKIHEDSLAECETEFSNLISSVELAVAAKVGGQEAMDGAERVKEVLAERIDSMREEFEEDIASLRENQLMVQQILNLPEGAKRDEMTKLLLEDAGEIEEMDKFKASVTADIEEGRNGFMFMISDIKSSLEEGGIEELEALLEAMNLEDAQMRAEEEDEEGEGCSGGGCGSCSLEDGCGDVADALTEMSEPYTVSAKSDKND